MPVVHYKEEHKLKFYNVIVEWLEVKKGIRNSKKQNNFTKLFVSSIEKNGITMDAFVQNELNTDKELAEYIKLKGL